MPKPVAAGPFALSQAAATNLPNEPNSRPNSQKQNQFPIAKRTHRKPPARRARHFDKMVQPNNMERASKLIRGLKLPGGTLTGEELACAVWPQAVGRKIAAHTRAARMVRTRLIVEVEDQTWQRQLNALSRHILWNLEQTLGRGMVEDLEFRVVPRRREPQRAAEAVPALFADESDAIADPVMRSIYRASRKKALA
jgi:hypothetical protein